MAFGRVVNSAPESTLLGSQTARLLRARRSRISRLVFPGSRVYSARLANCAPSPGKVIDDQPPGLLRQSYLLCSARNLRNLLRARRSRISRLVYPGTRVYSARLANCAPSPGKVIDEQPPGLPEQSCLLCLARNLRAFSGKGARVYSARLANCAPSPGKAIEDQPPGLPGQSCLLCSARELRAFSGQGEGSRVYSARPRELRAFYGQGDRGSAAWSTQALVSTLLGLRTARLLRARRSRISRLVYPGTRVYSARLANCAPPPGKAIEDQPPGLPGQSCLLCSAREKRAFSGQGDRR
ncbi:uncharacterized protein LOC124639926 isoform X1 [Helicoverpa zea]|uniref:uncharacterized protein LOC124639926 isoform X1 n=1 Tax=Helicoverpa zea TaxID=7113 RepID=UPI001F58606C|nr:uncharacterized protein LOC124639926 isoform X1 [Helicoverpa zea]